MSDITSKKAKVYKAIRKWIQYRKLVEKKYIMNCLINDICIYCNEPMDGMKFCRFCEQELHNLYYPLF